MKNKSNKKRLVKLATSLAGVSVALGLTNGVAVASGLVAYRIKKNINRYNNITIKKLDPNKFNSLHEEIEKALECSQKCDYDYDYAILHARRAFEKTLKLIIEDSGAEPTNETFENLKICEDKKLLDNELIHKLHKVRIICNRNIHEIEAEVSKEDINFVITQTQNLLKEAENINKIL